MDADLLVRGGTVVDGTGAPPRRADVVVRAGRVAEVVDPGSGGGSTRRTVDASGCVVMPGVIDPHTHLDAQLCWDGTASPSSRHGVTTVLTGMCGFGVAPCPDDGGEYLLRSLEVVEEIPYESTSLGVPFAWGTFADYLAFLDEQPLAVHVGAMVPHSSLRWFVMGERARGEVADDDERAALVAELDRSLAAGGLGFASSRGPNHQDAHGEPVVSRHADDAEIRALVGRCRRRPWQINARTKFAGDVDGLLAEVGTYADWTAEAGARLTWSPFFVEPDGRWRAVLEAHDRFATAGATVAPQVCAQPFMTPMRFDRPGLAGMVRGWGGAMASLLDLDPDARRARLADPSFRDELRAVPEDCDTVLAPCAREWMVATSPRRPDVQGRSLADAAAAERIAPTDLLCDLLLADDGATVLQVPVVNRDRGGVDAVVGDDRTLVGLGDSGAHVLSVTNYTYPTTVLADLVRDREVLTLEHAVQRLTAHPADFFGLADRGRIRPGCVADLVVVDLDALALGPLTVADDLPGGAERLLRDASGYRAVVVAGVVTLADDRPTGAAPGTVLRALSS